MVRTLAGWGDPRADSAPPSGRVVIVVDQFEEIFTSCQDEDERVAFIDALSAVGAGTGDCRPSALVVLGLRADFYPHTLHYRQLVPTLQHGQVIVGPMTTEELRRAIVEPAIKARIDLQDGLVEILLREIAPKDSASGGAHDAGSLPLLSHALLTTWERGIRGSLSIADYRATGGIDGAVARTADEIYDGLTATEQRLARQIFLRLVHVADDTGDTRRRVDRAELLLINGDAQSVLDRFIEHRLITAETSKVEIAHEALLMAWPQLRSWVDADRSGLHVHRQLTAAAAIWLNSDRDPGALYRGARLINATDWAAEPLHRHDLNPAEREFLDVSVEHDRAEARTTRRRTARLKQLLATSLALVAIAGLLATYAFQQSDVAQQQRDRAISRQVADEAATLRATDPALAMQLALAAFRASATPEARASVIEAYDAPSVTRMLGHSSSVLQSVAVADHGRLLATGSADSTVQLWSLSRAGHPLAVGPPLVGHTDTVFSVAFSPDGRVLASGSGDKTVRLWDVSRPTRPTPLGRPLSASGATVYSVAFSPDGHTLAAGGADDRIRLWNIADPGHPMPVGAPIAGPTDFVQSIAFSPDGRTLAAGSKDRTVRLWDVGRPGHPRALGRPLAGFGKTVFSVAFSPDGRTLAAGSADRTVRVWSLTERDRPARLGPPITGPTGWVNALEFSPDGRTLAAASSDSKAWIWNVATRKTVAVLPHPGPVTAIAFLARDDTVVTAAADGVTRKWMIGGPQLSGPTDSIFSATISSGNQTLALAAADNTAQLWNIGDPHRPLTLSPQLKPAVGPGPATGASALSPDAHTLAVGASDGSVALWDVRNPAKPIMISTRLTGPGGSIEAISFSPNGRTLAAGSDDRKIWLWDVTDPNTPQSRGLPITGFTNYVYSPTFSPDGRTLAAASADNTVRLWDVTKPSRPISLGGPIVGHTSYVFSLAFSPDGRTLVTGSADNTVRLWNIADRRRPEPSGPPLRGPHNYVYSVAFSPDGRTVAASAGDGTVWLWNVTNRQSPRLLATFTASKSEVFVDAFGPNPNVLVTAGADDTARIWNINTEEVAGYLCSVTGTTITRAEWKEYVPGRPYEPPCLDNRYRR